MDHTWEQMEEPVKGLNGGYLAAKRLIDIVGSLVGIILFLPILVICALLVAKEDGFPVIFKQKRLTRGGREFPMFKLRSMVKNAEDILKANPAMMAEYQLNYKLDHDPRILKIGQFLRKASLDELPQLFNVLRGEMSLVGPRPIVPSELSKFAGEEDWYLQLKPGLAGLWQCSGRNEIGYPDCIEYDRAYFKTASVMTDFKILFLTVFAVLRRRGAQ